MIILMSEQGGRSATAGGDIETGAGGDRETDGAGGGEWGGRSDGSDGSDLIGRSAGDGMRTGSDSSDPSERPREVDIETGTGGDRETDGAVVSFLS